MKILIIKPSSLGDIIHGLQVAQSTKEQLPSTQIHWIIKDRFEDIVKLCPTVDHYFIYQRNQGPLSFLKLLKSLRNQEYDCVLDFQGLLRSGLMMFASKSKIKIGRTDAREFSWIFQNKTALLPKEGKNSHAIDILLNFLPLLDLKPKLFGKLTFNTPPISVIDRRLSPENKPIVLFPNSRQPRKEWPGFVDLALELLQNFKNQYILWDSHLPSSSLPHSLSQNPYFINTSSKTPLSQMLSLVSNAKLVIANDSGPMHLAAAMQVPLVAIFGPTPKNRFGPYPLTRKTNLVIEAPNQDLSQLNHQFVSQIIINNYEQYK